MSIARADNDSLQDEVRDIVASNLRALMARRRVTATLLAKQLGVSQPSMSRRLNGQQAIDVEELVWLADYFEVPVFTLLEGVRSRWFSPLAEVEAPEGQLELALYEAAPDLMLVP